MNPFPRKLRSRNETREDKSDSLDMLSKWLQLVVNAELPNENYTRQLIPKNSENLSRNPDNNARELNWNKQLKDSIAEQREKWLRNEDSASESEEFLDELTKLTVENLNRQAKRISSEVPTLPVSGMIFPMNNEWKDTGFTKIQSMNQEAYKRYQMFLDVYSKWLENPESIPTFAVEPLDPKLTDLSKTWNTNMYPSLSHLPDFSKITSKFFELSVIQIFFEINFF